MVVGTRTNRATEDIYEWKMAFGRHETFHLRDGWLTKGLVAVERDPSAFLKPGCHHELGIGINMAKSIRYWLEACGLCEPMAVTLPGKNRPAQGLKLSSLGRLILDSDPYFESPSSSWLVHVNLANSSDLAPAWYWTFNLSDTTDFTSDQLESGVFDFAESYATNVPTESSVRKDVRCLIRTYLQVEGTDRLSSADDPLGSPLSSLGLVTKARSSDRHRLVFGHHPSLPIEVFMYVMYEFAGGEQVLNFDSARWRIGSPGRLLCLDSDEIRSLIARAQLRYGTGVISEVQTAGLDNIHLDQDASAVGFVSDYFAGLRSGGG